MGLSNLKLDDVPYVFQGAGDGLVRQRVREAAVFLLLAVASGAVNAATDSELGVYAGTGSDGS